MPKHTEPTAPAPAPVPAPPPVVVPPAALVPPVDPPSRSELRDAQRAEQQAAKAEAQVVARYTGGAAGAYEEGIKAQDIGPAYWATLSEAQQAQVRASQVYEMTQ